MIFRFDDISINSDIQKLGIMVDLVDAIDAEIMLAISPIVFKSEKETGRVFPAINSAQSSHTVNYHGDTMGIPEVLHWDCIIASHGLAHEDHRILSYNAQELNIIQSCSLIDTKIFVPPFNKWNTNTERVCEENNIELIKFEDGWLSCEHNKYDTKNDKWYLHSWQWETAEDFNKWIHEI